MQEFIKKKKLGFGASGDFGLEETTLMTSNKEKKDTMEIVESHEGSAVLLKGVTKAIENETKEQRDGFLGMLLGTLAACVLGNMLAGMGMIRVTR